MMTNRPWLAAVGVAMLGSAVTSCATLPTSGTVQLRSLQGTSGQAQPGVQIVPVPPGRDWSPVSIVSGFLAASASFDNKHHAVARRYLTAGPRGYASKWQPAWAATVIDAPQVSQATVIQPGRHIETAGPPQARVEVTGGHLARLNTPGRYQAGGFVVQPASTRFTFSLVQQKGEWRIDGISVDGKPASRTFLLLTRSDFERDYQPRNLYFLSDRNELVPDPVFIPQQVRKGGLKGLVEALVTPLPGSSWLYGAARTAFPKGTKVLGGVRIIGGVKAIVDLGGAAAKASPARQRLMAAQLTSSLAGPISAGGGNTQIRSVVLELNHRAVPMPRHPGHVPRGLGTSLYYQVPGVAAGPAIVVQRPGSEPAPVALPRGLGQDSFAAIAVAPGGRTVLAGCTSQNLYLAPHGAEPAMKRLPAACTSLSWDEAANLWIATRKELMVVPAAGTGAPGQSSLVPVIFSWLTSAPNATVTSLRVAPDGVRVAVIVRVGSSSKIIVAAISRRDTLTYLGQSGQVLRVGSDISDPTALAWLDPDHLLAFSGPAGGRTRVFEVPLNGGQSTEVAAPRGVTSIAASGQAPPHIVIGLAPTATAAAKIEMSKTALPNPVWLPVAKGTTPVFPG
jgi:hypothetical protein